MDVAADYAKVVDAMRRPQPAYVAYAIDQTVAGIANVHDTGRVVVRTADGSVVHGHAPSNEQLPSGPRSIRRAIERTAKLRHAAMAAPS